MVTHEQKHYQMVKCGKSISKNQNLWSFGNFPTTFSKFSCTVQSYVLTGLERTTSVLLNRNDYAAINLQIWFCLQNNNQFYQKSNFRCIVACFQSAQYGEGLALQKKNLTSLNTHTPISFISSAYVVSLIAFCFASFITIKVWYAKFIYNSNKSPITIYSNTQHNSCVHVYIFIHVLSTTHPRGMKRKTASPSKVILPILSDLRNKMEVICIFWIDGTVMSYLIITVIITSLLLKTIGWQISWWVKNEGNLW